MKSFLLGALGALLTLILVAIIYPQYSDYRAKAETVDWLIEVKPLQLDIQKAALRQGSLTGSAKGLKEPNFSLGPINFFSITDEGVIIIKGGSHGQMLVLSPYLNAGGVMWQCIGGSDIDVPRKCKAFNQGK